MVKKKSFMEEQYGLRGMPFKTKIGAPFELASWVDREDEKERWDKVLDDAKNSPNVNFFVYIIGDYGMGKTLSLFKVIDDAKSKQGIFSVYLNLLSEQKPKNPGLDFIQRIFRVIDFDLITIKKHDIALLQKTFPEVATVLTNIVLSDDVKKKSLCLAFLRGEIKPNATQLNTMGILRKIDDVDVAKQYLIGMLYLLKASEFSALLLAIDEFEYLFSLVTSSSQSIYLALLRSLFDLPAQLPNEFKSKIANMIFMIGISEDGIRRLEDLEKIEKDKGGPIQPLKRRVTDRILLKPFNKEVSQKLIERRLHLNRIAGKYEEEPLIPFSEDFIEYIYQLSGGRLADIIVRCDVVLDMGLEKCAPKLTPEFAKEALKEKGFTY